ncbi:mitochondrial 39-S ribosomal protein L47 (MRP-L47)-domain-containing protein [Talaromyces proteolyticus]|uniref:Large ribosomal subunit protein uL29m n=1 Tax=Talaromyces proteolyticus TaxID=1131652 RepID=A0AAD4KGI5_9EURO|nr:mitochondrial 39-S ribosomal protein L47 (MRP-L47)-domain-containing protein [Talaromyces proteolyticus]KAH8691346.1 mitochondrial 39-S ribosomal protein L47 (MRP-L47)-domain-containing protein [Talaromyces proteolyticus]
MNRQTVIRVAAQSKYSLFAELPPPYLAPALHSNAGSSTQHASFSCTASNAARRGPDRSKSRGVSAIHMTGPKYRLGVSKYPLPTPVTLAERPARDPTPDHGLWGFFPPDRLPLSTPEYDIEHGRAWSLQELRGKSWDDLHCLWWVCVKERNRIATSDLERGRSHAGYGEIESRGRAKVVRETQKAIKNVLRERWYAWEDARELWYKREKKIAKKRGVVNDSLEEDEGFGEVEESSQKPEGVAEGKTTETENPKTPA